MRVQDNCIFSISPKAGSLSPGQEQVVELKYRCSLRCLPYTSGPGESPPPHHCTLSLPLVAWRSLALHSVTPGYPKRPPPMDDAAHPLGGRTLLPCPNSGGFHLLPAASGLKASLACTGAQELRPDLSPPFQPPVYWHRSPPSALQGVLWPGDPGEIPDLILSWAPKRGAGNRAPPTTHPRKLGLRSFC